MAFNLIDTFFIGQGGEQELAALTFTFPVIMVVFNIIQGLGIGAIFLRKELFGIAGIFMGIAFTFASGGILSVFINQ